MTDPKRPFWLPIIGAAAIGFAVGVAVMDDESDRPAEGRPVPTEMSKPSDGFDPLPDDNTGPPCHCVHRDAEHLLSAASAKESKPVVERTCWHDEPECNANAVRDCEDKWPRYECAPFGMNVSGIGDIEWNSEKPTERSKKDLEGGGR